MNRHYQKVLLTGAIQRCSEALQIIRCRKLYWSLIDTLMDVYIHNLRSDAKERLHALSSWQKGWFCKKVTAGRNKGIKKFIRIPPFYLDTPYDWKTLPSLSLGFLYPIITLRCVNRLELTDGSGLPHWGV